MRFRTLIVVLVLTAGIIGAAVFMENRSATAAADEDQAIRKATDAYVAAFNRGDLDAVLAFWTADPEFVDETGKITKGRDALAALFKKTFQEEKGIKLALKTGTLRFLKDDVAMQEGSATLTLANGETDTDSFTAVWIKKDGKWLLQLVRESPSPDAATEGSAPHLKELAWLVGEWTQEENDRKTNITCRWMKGEKFLVLDYTVQNKDVEPFSLYQIIGWDPSGDKIHSWVFDSRGGFGEGLWSRNGTTWTVESAGLTADGRHGTGTSKWTVVDADTFSYQTSNREIDGQPIPDVKLSYQRVKKNK